MITILTVLVAFAGSWRNVYAFPKGAPAGQCTLMTPSHYASSPSQTDPPYTVSVSSNEYSAGSTITVTISSPCGKKFRGFMLEARRADANKDMTIAMGNFTAVTGTKTVDCVSGQALTHDNRDDKSSVEIVWTAPPQAVGHIVFKATIVQTFSTFWVGTFSQAVLQSGLQAAVEPGSNQYPSTNSCPTTSTVPTQTTTMPTTVAKMGNIARDINCGKSKGCFHNCSVEPCDFLVSWYVSENKKEIRFEIASVVSDSDNLWVAIGFSDDKFMGNDSVVECVVHNGQINVYSSYNYPFIRHNGLSDSYGVRKTEASLVNGIIRCSFDREIDANFDKNFMSLDEDWYLFIAQGKTDASGVKEPHRETRPLSSFEKIDFFTTYESGISFVSSGKTFNGFHPILLLILSWVARTLFY